MTLSMKNDSNGRAIAIAAICLAAGHPWGKTSIAQDVDNSVDGAAHMEEMVVTATRTEHRVSDLPVSANVITREDLDNATNIRVDDIMRTVPGIDVPAESSLVIHPTGNNVSMRGLGSRRALFLIDGVPFNDPFFGYIQWNRVPSEILDSVEVVRGGSSSVYGSQGLGGVVNLRTRAPEDRTFEFSTLYGSDDTRRYSAYVSERFFDRWGVSLNVNQFYADGYLTIEDSQRGAIDRENDTESLNINFKTDCEFDEAYVFFKANYFDNESNHDTHLSDNSTETYDIALGADWRLAVNDEVRTSFHMLDQEFETNNTSLTDPPSRDTEFLSNLHDNPVQDFGGSLQWMHDLHDTVLSMPSTTVLLGGDVRHLDGNNRTSLFSAPEESPTLRDGGGKQLFLGFFGQLDLNPIEDLGILLSGRVDYYENYDGFLELAPGGATRLRDDSITRINPKLAMRYQLTDFLALRGSVYKAFRAPNLNELFRAFSSTTIAIEANPDLKPETMKGGEIGFEVDHGTFYGQVNFFQNNVDDFIGTVPTAFSPVFTLTRFNVGELRSRGVDVDLKIVASDTVTFEGGYSFIDTDMLEFDQRPAFEGNDNAEVPHHKGFVGVMYSGQDLRASARGRAVGERFNDLGNDPNRELESHFVLDLQVSYQIYPGVEIYGIGQNVLDEDYDVDISNITRVGAPAQGFVGLRAKF